MSKNLKNIHLQFAVEMYFYVVFSEQMLSK